MIEKIKIWKPLSEIGGRYWFESVFYENYNLIFSFKKHEQQDTHVRIVCKGHVGSYKYTDESYKQESFEYIDTIEDIKAVRPWCFYKVENSCYLKIMSEESNTWSDHIHFEHYCVLGVDEVIDIISAGEPVVELYEGGKLIQSSTGFEEQKSQEVP
jgi:hypothetical protein